LVRQRVLGERDRAQPVTDVGDDDRGALDRRSAGPPRVVEAFHRLAELVDQ